MLGKHKNAKCENCHKGSLTNKPRFTKCYDCHENIHGNEISDKCFDENKCESCHSTWAWKNVDFKHNKTDFELLGKHKNVSCSDCHFIYNNSKVLKQRFASLDQGCVQYHKDIHFRQFVDSGKEFCVNCHTLNNWNPVLFDHNNTRFSLDGAHKNLSRTNCHKEIEKGEVRYINYKIKDAACKSCHS